MFHESGAVRSETARQVKLSSYDCKQANSAVLKP